MAAVPSTGRATEVEQGAAPEVDVTRGLYERHAGQIYGFCLKRLRSREEAEDATQTTFLNAFRGLRRGVVPEAEAAWLFKIAENVCLTRRRSAWRRGRVESPSDMQALQDLTPARDAGHRDDLIPLGDALTAMPESQRRAILLREWQGLSYKEIADEMDLSQSAVETLIFRARRSLANALETPWGERRAAGQAGRRAFDLGSLLAGLKGLFGGATAAKVAIVAVAATGTAAVAVAETRDHPSPRPAEPRVAESRVPDSRPDRSLAVRSPVSAPATTAERRIENLRSRASASGAETRSASATAPSRPAEKTSPGQAKEPGTPTPKAGSGRGHTKQAKPKAAAKPKAQHATKPKTKVVKPRPKPAATARPRPRPRPKPKHPVPPPPKTQAPKADEPKAATPPAPPAPPPPPADPAGKDKDKAQGESAP